MNGNRITMNGNGKKIVDKKVNFKQAKIIETDEARKLRANLCQQEIARALKKYDCKFVVVAEPKIEVHVNPKKM